MAKAERSLSIIVVGASGDLARKKILPALFGLYCQGFLPPQFQIFGFARSSFTDEAFRERITENLTCRYVPDESCEDRMQEFLARCFYISGSYESSDSFLDLYQRMQDIEDTPETNRLFYLAIPPSIFLDVAHAIGDAGLVQCGQSDPWSRVVIEKPFGRDRASSDELTREMGKVFRESQTFRIDHYLGKEVVQNLMVMRFANLVFEPIWNSRYIKDVHISWEEDLDVAGRGGYFDDYGIVRDVIQNHLVQIMALVAMEDPNTLDARDIRDEKVRALRCVRPVELDDIVLGQYTAATHNGRDYIGYTEDETVPTDSLIPTFAAVKLDVQNPRWEGVPFYIRAGKGLGERKTEIRIRFREVPGNMFKHLGGNPEPNELIVRVQPDEGILLHIMNKVPGIDMQVGMMPLDLLYKHAYDQVIPDAYESLILDVLQGDKTLFIRKDELEAAWDVFTPVLHRIDDEHIAPVPYPFGSDGPPLTD